MLLALDALAISIGKLSDTIGLNPLAVEELKMLRTFHMSIGGPLCTHSHWQLGSWQLEGA